jgi:hypothetical protein
LKLEIDVEYGLSVEMYQLQHGAMHLHSIYPMNDEMDLLYTTDTLSLSSIIISRRL